MTADEALVALQSEATKLDALIELVSNDKIIAAELQTTKALLAQIVALIESNQAKLAKL